MALFSVLVVAGCEDDPNFGSRRPFDVEFSSEPLPSTRPVYRLVRTGERCIVRIEQNGGVREPLTEPVACPRELELGGSIRLAEKSCMRALPEGERPTLCPDVLVEALETDRAPPTLDR